MKNKKEIHNLIRLFKLCYIQEKVLLAEIIGRIVLINCNNIEVDKGLRKIEEKQLERLDECGRHAYHFREINKDSKYWLELWKHVINLDEVISMLRVKKKSLHSIETIRIADAWLLVHLSITNRIGILPHEQMFLTNMEQKFWHFLEIKMVSAEALYMWGKAPLVSVMIPAYNLADIFTRTIRSAAIQDYPNLEIIVCDNSTNEKIAEIMTQYKYDKRIHYVRNTQAITKRENFACFERNVKGEYLQWLMHDDILSPSKISKMAKILYDHKEIKLVGSQRRVIDIDGNYKMDSLTANLPIDGDGGIFSSPELGLLMLVTYSNIIGEPSSVLFRRKDLKHHYWQAAYKQYKVISDVGMWLELMEKGNVYIFKDSLSYYRRHKQQEGQKKDVILRSRIEWYWLISEYYKKKIYIRQKRYYVQALRSLVNEFELYASEDNADSREMWMQYSKMIEECRLVLGEYR